MPSLSSLLTDRRGAAMAQFAIIAPFFFGFVLFMIEFGIGMRNYNAAAKAAAVGARMAAVSSPVSASLQPFVLDDGVTAGDPFPAFDITCSGATSTCSSGAFNATAFNWILRGGDNVCGRPFSGRLGICDFYPRVTAANVIIDYQHDPASGAPGYAGRPFGPVPSITVRLTGLTYNTPILGSFSSGPLQLNMPTFATTVTGEDLAGTPGA
jgi:TadE-like protein